MPIILFAEVELGGLVLILYVKQFAIKITCSDLNFKNIENLNTFFTLCLLTLCLLTLF